MSTWSKSCTNIFNSYLKNDDQIRQQFCTCHDNTAVVTCAKLLPDWINGNIMKAEINFLIHVFRLWPHKAFKWNGTRFHVSWHHQRGSAPHTWSPPDKLQLESISVGTFFISSCFFMWHDSAASYQQNIQCKYHGLHSLFANSFFSLFSQILNIKLQYVLT